MLDLADCSTYWTILEEFPQAPFEDDEFRFFIQWNIQLFLSE